MGKWVEKNPKIDSSNAEMAKCKEEMNNRQNYSRQKGGHKLLKTSHLLVFSKYELYFKKNFENLES